MKNCLGIKKKMTSVDTSSISEEVHSQSSKGKIISKEEYDS